MVSILFKLLAGHALGDYALQGEFIATNKNRHFKPKGYDPALHGPQQTIWPYVLTSHALIHGLFVYLATASIGLGIAETCAHWLIDFAKCEKWFGIHIDQALHLICKVLWVYLSSRGAL
jgi:hypothetical protein